MQTVATSGDAALAASTAGRRHFNSKYLLTIGAFLLPSVLLYSLLVFFPLFQAGYYGLYDWNGLGPLEDYVGLQNFRNVLSDETFRQAIGHNLIILFLSLLIQLPIALALALIVGRHLRGRAVFRTIFFLPYVLSEVVTGVMWSFLFHPRTGLNELFGKIIPGYEPIGWLSDPNIVLYSLFIAITWKFVGFHFILYLAGLQSIPKDLEESAKLDGASNLRVIRDVTIPLLGPTIRSDNFSFRHRFTAVLRSYLGHDRRWPDRRQPDYGDLYVQVQFSALRAWIWRGGLARHLRHLLRLCPALHALRHEPRLFQRTRLTVLKRDFPWL